MMTRIMKTTIDLPDDLMVEAKAVAARRRTTLKAMMEHALRREVMVEQAATDPDAPFTIDEHGMPILKKTGNAVVTSEMIYRMMDEGGI
ncbi:MAG: hypothetical protein ACI9VS_001706 [Candidatus Binatia bacterium]|jgi:hypothetical protein